jgi:hypothetical protein
MNRSLRGLGPPGLVSQSGLIMGRPCFDALFIKAEYWDILYSSCQANFNIA